MVNLVTHRAELPGITLANEFWSIALKHLTQWITAWVVSEPAEGKRGSVRIGKAILEAGRCPMHGTEVNSISIRVPECEKCIATGRVFEDCRVCEADKQDRERVDLKVARNPASEQ